MQQKAKFKTKQSMHHIKYIIIQKKRIKCDNNVPNNSGLSKLLD